MDYDIITCEVDTSFEDLMNEYDGLSKITNYNGDYMPSIYRAVYEVHEKLLFTDDMDKFNNVYGLNRRHKTVGKTWVTISYVENCIIKVNLLNLFALYSFTNIGYMFLWLMEFIKCRDYRMVKYYIRYPKSNGNDMTITINDVIENEKILNYLMKLRIYFSYDHESNLLNIAHLIVNNNISRSEVIVMLNYDDLSIQKILINIFQSLILTEDNSDRLRDFVAKYEELLIELNVYDTLSNFLAIDK